MPCVAPSSSCRQQRGREVISRSSGWAKTVGGGRSPAPACAIKRHSVPPIDARRRAAELGEGVAPRRGQGAELRHALRVPPHVVIPTSAPEDVGNPHARRRATLRAPPRGGWGGAPGEGEQRRRRAGPHALLPLALVALGEERLAAVQLPGDRLELLLRRVPLPAAQPAEDGDAQHRGEVGRAAAERAAPAAHRRVVALRARLLLGSRSGRTQGCFAASDSRIAFLGFLGRGIQEPIQ
eukprot:gene35-biopygen4310